jgi:hypothetical protein
VIRPARSTTTTTGCLDVPLDDGTTRQVEIERVTWRRTPAHF